MKRTQKKSKVPVPVKVIAVLLMSIPLMLLGMTFTSLYLHFFGSYPIPEDADWYWNIAFMFAASAAIIFAAVQLFRGKNYARAFAIAIFVAISLTNLRAEFFIADSVSIIGVAFNLLFLAAAAYLGFSKDVKKAFSKS